MSQLRHRSDEWNVPEDPRILRALADLGDTDAFLPLQLLGMTDMQTLSEFTNANGLTANRIVKEKLIDTAQAYEWRLGH